MNEITLKCFLSTYKESCSNDGRYCFILGAGASKESGIMTGMEMAQIWSDELNTRYNKNELLELMKKLNIKDITVSSKNYFNIYDLRFFPDYQNGYSYIARSMENAQPSYGYYPLAMEIASTNNNLVITTNFDTMVEDALFIYTDKRPIVVGHESLAGYININTKRPVIAKIHRGLYFEPFNRPKELAGLSEAWKKVLKTAFQVYTPIVIGYAGGDNSLMDFLKDSTLEMKGLFWCYYKYDKLSKDIIDLVKSKNGYFVQIDGFDSMMFKLSQICSYDDPSDGIKRTTNNRIKMFRDKYAEFSSKAKSIANPDENETEIIDMLNNKNINKIQMHLKQIEKTPNDSSEYFLLAYQYELNKEDAKAVESYSRAIELQPDFTEAYYNRGTIYLNTKEYENAILDFNKAIELSPNMAEALCHRGIIFNIKKEYDKAIFDFNRAIESSPNLAQVYYHRGNSYAEKEEYNKAISDFSKVIDLKPDRADVYYKRGVMYNNKYEYDKAILDFNRAIELKPDYPEAYCKRGNAHHNKEEHDLAITDFNKAVELKPDYTEAYCKRGSVYSFLKKYDMAIMDFNKAIDLEPNYAESFCKRGIFYSDKEEYQKAIQDYTKALDLHPNCATVYNNRGFAYYAIKDYEKALDDVNRSIEINPNDEYAYDSRGCIYKDIKDYKQALYDFNKAIELDPKKEEIYRNRAEVFMALGEDEKAKVDIETANLIADNNKENNI